MAKDFETSDLKPGKRPHADTGEAKHPESAKSQPIAGHEGNTGVSFGEAEHHMRAGQSEPHRFPNATGATGAHGFGHSATNRKGSMRMSGHSGAHRIGSKK